MKQRRFKSSIVIPLVLLIYLAGMAYYGRGMLIAGQQLQYYGVIACTLVILVILHFSLKRKEKLRAQRDEEIYTTYNDEEKRSSSSDDAESPSDK